MLKALRQTAVVYQLVKKNNRYTPKSQVHWCACMDFLLSLMLHYHSWSFCCFCGSCSLPAQLSPPSRDPIPTELLTHPVGCWAWRDGSTRGHHWVFHIRGARVWGKPSLSCSLACPKASSLPVNVSVTPQLKLFAVTLGTSLLMDLRGPLLQPHM